MSLHGSPLFINNLSRELGNLIRDRMLTEAFSTGKDELFLVFGNFAMKVTFWKGEAIISFPDPSHLPRKNRINQYKDACGLTIDAVDEIHLERAFRIRTGTYFIFFKLFGARGNVLFGKGDEVIASFRHNLQRDIETGVAFLDSSELNIVDVHYEDQISFSKSYPFLRGDLQDWVFTPEDKEEQVNRLEELKYALAKPEWVVFENDDLGISMKGLGDQETIIMSSNSAIEVQDFFARRYIGEARLKDAREKARKRIREELNRTNERFHRLEYELQKREKGSKFRLYADVLMANLWQLKEGEEQVNLADFEGEVINIPLKKDLSPQKNAERYYRKAKNEHLEIEQLKSEWDRITQRKLELEKEEKEINSARFLKDIPIAPQQGKADSSRETPYKITSSGGFEIWIGKSAESNEVILRRAGKFDTWLHARDVPGSHVLIRNQEKRPIPGFVLEEAASLAAGHSKRKTEGLVAVIYTERRYVRKFKGARPGQVKVDREEVILVPPKKSA